MARDVAVRQISDEARPISFKGVALLFVSKEEIVRQRCRCCGGRFDREAGFRKRKLDISSYDTHPDCILCEQTERDKKKADRWLIKARDTVRRHAQHDKLTAREFTSRFGWDVKRVAHILEHAYGNTCEYCRELYSLMPSGLQSITMDIIDREKPPHLERIRSRAARRAIGKSRNGRLNVGQGIYAMPQNGKRAKRKSRKLAVDCRSNLALIFR